jgi:ABC transporter with metal-binding/Fe-S-binding domain ATP-binding protein
MRLASLFSGGKDSTYASFLASREGEIVHLVTVKPKLEDSWMFHTVNLHLVPLLAEVQGLELVTVESSGEKEAELEELKEALGALDIDGIVTGAIASSYQKERVDAICDELGLTHISPLWGRSSPELLDEVIEVGMEVLVTVVAAMGLDEHWLGRVLDQNAVGELKELSLRHGFDVCGEGGELETLVVDAPWFRKRLEITGARKEWDGVRGIYVVEETRLVPSLRVA